MASMNPDDNYEDVIVRPITRKVGTAFIAIGAGIDHKYFIFKEHFLGVC